MDGFEIKGVELLNDSQKIELNKELEAYSEKLKWKTKSDFSLKLVIKEGSVKSGDKKEKQKRYSLKATIKGETHSFEANAEEWDFNKSLHRVFDKLINEVEHAYHSSEQRS